MSTIRILEARALEGYKLWLKFSDGNCGKADLSHMAGKGVFSLWDQYENFRTFSVESSRFLVWADEIDIDADSLYMKVTGKNPEELFPALEDEHTYA